MRNDQQEENIPTRFQESSVLGNAGHGPTTAARAKAFILVNTKLNERLAEQKFRPLQIYCRPYMLSNKINKYIFSNLCNFNSFLHQELWFKSTVNNFYFSDSKADHTRLDFHSHDNMEMFIRTFFLSINESTNFIQSPQNFIQTCYLNGIPWMEYVLKRFQYVRFFLNENHIHS